MICVIHKFVCDFVFKVFVSNYSKTITKFKMDELKQDLKEAKDKLKKVENDIEKYKLNNTEWITLSPAEYHSGLLKGLMRKESDLNQQITALSNTYNMHQGNTIIKLNNSILNNQNILNDAFLLHKCTIQLSLLIRCVELEHQDLLDGIVRDVNEHWLPLVWQCFLPILNINTTQEFTFADVESIFKSALVVVSDTRYPSYGWHNRNDGEDGNYIHINRKVIFTCIS